LGDKRVQSQNSLCELDDLEKNKKIFFSQNRNFRQKLHIPTGFHPKIFIFTVFSRKRWFRGMPEYPKFDPSLGGHRMDQMSLKFVSERSILGRWFRICHKKMKKRRFKLVIFWIGPFLKKPLLIVKIRKKLRNQFI